MYEIRILDLISVFCWQWLWPHIIIIIIIIITVVTFDNSGLSNFGFFFFKVVGERGVKEGILCLLDRASSW